MASFRTAVDCNTNVANSIKIQNLDAHITEAVELLKQLIATPSRSRDEARTADLLHAFLAQCGAAPERLANNVWARAEGFDPARPTLLLNSHHDTVRPAASYTRDPYAPTVEDGKLYGLGSNDAGASVVCLLETFLTFRTRPLPFNLVLGISAEEGCMGENGIRALYGPAENAAEAAEAGGAKYSRLDWYDARTPMPDNYRYLPSYTGDRETEQAWLARDPRYTQIDWDELIRQNRMAGGHAVYALEDRVERLCNLAFDASFATEADARLTLRYGVSLRRENTRSYKQMRDLLGAGYVTDIDRFLIDDDTYSNLLQNDLRHPGRTVREGDRFGYDYALTLRGAALRLQADYRSDRFRADLSVVLGSDAVSRRGYYEKELFPGGQSYGPSRVMRFTPYTLKAAAGWAFSPRRYIEIAAAAAARTPRAGDLFFQPLYNNRTVDNPVPERIYAAELNCRLTGPVVDFQAALFAAMTLDGIETRTYYDDMASVYCDMAVTGVGRMSCGAEAAADIRLSYRWLLSLAASAGCYEYIRDPRVTVLSDVDNSAVDVQAVSRMGGCETGGAPQLTALAEIAWFGPKGWGCRASAGYAGRRYVEPMPLRRTDRIAGQGGITREFFDAFTRQERLPDAFTLDAALFKSFRFERSRLTASLMLRNLTGEADTVYGGYESLRVRRIRPGDDTLYAPHASRCTYAWPRSFYLTISYRF